MIAYKKDWLKNLLVREQLEQAIGDQLISEEEKIALNKLYPVGFYTPNLFIRAGLFILTVVIVSFSFGLLSLVMMSVLNETTLGVLLIVFGLINYAALEYIVQEKSPFHSGVDDALLWMTGICVTGGINLVTEVSLAGNCVFIFIIAAYLLCRFAHTMLGAIVVASFLLLCFLQYTQWGSVARVMASFGMSALAAAIYFLSVYLYKKPAFIFYKKVLTAAQITALVGAYAGVNYFIVNESAKAQGVFNGNHPGPVPFAWLFWLFTIAVPFVYIFWGVKKKELVLIRIGLLLMAAIVFTIRYYHSIWPAETAMLLGGIVLIGIAYSLIKYLRQIKFGFTSVAAPAKNAAGKMAIEALIISETFGGVQPTPPAAPTNFGGGSFGGGGASGDF